MEEYHRIKPWIEQGSRRAGYFSEVMSPKLKKTIPNKTRFSEIVGGLDEKGAPNKTEL